MKVICNREELLHAFSIAASVVKPQSTKSVLKNIKLEADDETVILLGTDLEIGIRIQVPGVQIEQPGTVLLPVDRVGTLLKESIEETFILESSENLTLIKAGKNTFKFPTEDPEGFPEIATFDEPNYVSLPNRFLKEGIRRTIYALDTQTGRYALGGVRFDLKDNTLYFVATDGRRLAKQEVSVQTVGEIPSEMAIIVLPRTLQIIERILGNSDEDVFLVFRDQQSILLKTQNIVLYSTLLEGKYPNWRKMVEQTYEPRKITLPVRPFSSVLRQAAIVADRITPGVLLEFCEGKLVLTCQSQDLGESHLEIPISYEEESLQVKLNPYYLIDFLRTLDQDTVITMNILDDKSAVTFFTEDGYLYLVMPLAIHRA
ncbi:MAG: DNA polymerase III subunit beta [Planctomycetia bacterium]|nr:DNA polymerase III subunit beta [Planctomycetia bacterium]